MNKQDLIVGVDIGSTKVAVCIGTANEGIVSIISLTKAVNSGMRKGTVVDIEDCISSISTALELAENAINSSIYSAFIAIGGNHTSVASSRGVIAVSRPNGEITETDVERVIEASRAIALPPNKEIIHVIPKYYIVDGLDNIKDPIGMSGVRLEVETLIVAGQTSAIRNLTKCVNQAGLNIDGLIYSPIASAKTLLNKKQKESGVLLLDIGGGTTSFVIFEEKDIIHAGIIPIGSSHITNDIAIGLKTSLENAEKIKIKFGYADSSKIRESEKIEMRKIVPSDDTKFEKKLVAEIIEARLKEIFDKIKNELRSVGKDSMLPAGAVLTGGGSSLEGIVELAKTELELPAQLGIPSLEISGMVDNIDNPIYSTSIGLMIEGYEQNQPTNFRFSLPKENISNIVEVIKHWLKKFLP
ncbi:MAG: cell division protein FtsA [Candidatus Berkelbacteria bacterium Licking1014_85]|uniref:Cell division protein FtsA n=1 Tax=Candidatus Berkelbacteria bacterium Licking1014_85 TaxID=2017148 RepID=A0A554LLK7_9BACT|nr:MAG: cell division protein FtsA [Candidatus Berkelbacteria bacterium Licking1014_85]